MKSLFTFNKNNKSKNDQGLEEKLTKLDELEKI